MKVLVTGAAGFIGFHLCRRLLSDGHEVVGFDVQSAGSSGKLRALRRQVLQRDLGFEVQSLDLTDGPGLIRLWEETRPDIVYHLAAQAGVRHSIDNPRIYVESNLVGFANILECCRKVEPQHFLYASSSSVYGANRTLPWSEDQKSEQPLSFYAATKKANEVMAHSYSAVFGLPATGLRFFTIYGEYGRPDMAFFKFTDAIMHDRPVELYNEGRSTRDFTYVGDAVEAMLRLARLPPEADSAGVRHRVLNIASGQRVVLTDLVRLISDALGRPAKPWLREMMSGDVSDTWGDVRQLKALTGYAPHTRVEEGVPRFVRWYEGEFRR